MQITEVIKAPKHFPKIGKLPTKPSALLTIALADLAASERAKRTINMGTWCDRESNKCSVCFAGSVMIGTLANTKAVKDLLKGNQTNLEPWNFIEEEQLKALNSLREGELENAFNYLNLDFPSHFKNEIEVTSYENNKKLFKKQMKALAKALEAEGY